MIFPEIEKSAQWAHERIEPPKPSEKCFSVPKAYAFLLMAIITNYVSCVNQQKAESRSRLRFLLVAHEQIGKATLGMLGFSLLDVTLKIAQIFQ